MSTLLRLLLHLKKACVAVLQWALIIAVAVLVLDVLWGVATRYLLGDQSSWTEELARLLLVWVVLLGAAVAYGEKAHLAVDLFGNRLDPQVNRVFSLCTHLTVAAFAVALLIIGGGNLTLEAARNEQMLMALEIPKATVYAVLPLSGVFFIIFACEAILESIAGTPPPIGEGETSAT